MFQLKAKLKAFVLVSLFLAFALTLAACAGSVPQSIDPSPSADIGEKTEKTPTILATSTVEPTKTQGAGHTPPATQAAPTAEPTPEPFQLPEEWQALGKRMETYGHVDEDQLSQAYYERLEARISKYGKATYITALEYHGDTYRMFDGAYSMDPESFFEQVARMMAQDYHFVTLPELEAFVYGKLALPSRSIILTSDLSAANIDSMASITDKFKKLEDHFGYRPHLQVYIWAGDMQADQNINCAADACWEALRRSKETGYFSFGSHSWAHDDASKLHINITKADFEKANAAIEANLGVKPYAIAWPFEASYDYTDRIAESGFTLAFGGLTRPSGPQLVQLNDPTPMRLPRLLPPAIDGISMRPSGKTLQDILDEQLLLNGADHRSRGLAERVLVLEYHGIDYNMYGGAYSSDSAAFASQLETLCKEGYQFFDLIQMTAFINRLGEMPAKSIMLTNDVTAKSVSQIPEISRIMREAEEKWDCHPHMTLFVVTNDMRSDQAEICKANACWGWLQEAAAEPSLISLGVHTATNLPYGEASPAWHLEDMLDARKAMEEKLGIKVNALSWPYEVCPLDLKPYKDAGFVLGFGGVSKPLSQNYVELDDPAPLCLPRMLPPNLNGTSIRPDGLTFEEMLQAALAQP